MQLNTPKIVTAETRKLIGLRLQTNLTENKARELWQKFRPQINSINNRMNENFFSVQDYGSIANFEALTPFTYFDKWAAVEVINFDNITLLPGLEKLVIAGGLYAIFIHRGTPSTFTQTAQYIYGHWLPSNGQYELAEGVHFEIMPSNYSPTNPEAEEEVWIPIKRTLTPLS